jgi:hypothetical protein
MPPDRLRIGQRCYLIDDHPQPCAVTAGLVPGWAECGIQRFWRAMRENSAQLSHQVSLRSLHSQPVGVTHHKPQSHRLEQCDLRSHPARDDEISAVTT